MALTPGTRLGVYEITAQIGEGGMGLVFRARDTTLSRDVALKVLPESFATDAERVARFTREAQTLAALNHPHIATIYGLEETNGVTALVMELVEGDDLSQRIARGPISIDEAVPIAKQIAEALEAAHEQGIIHRDLKPANIKVRSDGTVKVLDFGLAKAMDVGPGAAGAAGQAGLSMSPTLTTPAHLRDGFGGQAMTQAGMILGTAAYMAPEQARGRTVDRRADIWAFGCVLFEMLTGTRAFGGEDVADVLGAVMRLEPSWNTLPSDVPLPLRTVLHRCLVKDPQHRVAHISAVRFVLDNVASLVPLSVNAPVNRWRAIVPWIAAVAALVTAAVSIMVGSRTSNPQPVVRFRIAFLDRASSDSTFELSPDGRYLAFAAGVDGPRRLWVRALDSEEVRAVAGSEGATYPIWSPDSAFLAFFANGKLKKIAASGGTTQVLSDATDGRGGAWGVDGDIVFAASVTGPLLRVPSSGGTPSAVTAVGPSDQRVNDRYPSFIQGTRQFLFLRQTSAADTSGVYVGSLDGAPPVRLLPEQSSAYYAADSSGGKGWLVFRREESVVAQPFDPTTARLSGEAVQLATSVGTAGNTGKGAFSASTNGALTAWHNFTNAQAQLAWVDHAGQRLSEVTKPALMGEFRLSPDEKRVALWLGGERRDFWLHDLDGGALARFTSRESADGRPVWSPDSRTVVYAERPQRSRVACTGNRLIAVPRRRRSSNAALR